MNSVFVFRRDLRLEDNSGLIAALENSKKVLPCFIFDPRQLGGRYFSPNAFEFMLESLEDLGRRLGERGGRLYLFKGLPHEVIGSLLEKGFSAVYLNRDYTPFSRKRDLEIGRICKSSGAAFQSHGDSLLNEPEKVLKKDGKPYTIYTPYLRKAKTFRIREPVKNSKKNYYDGGIDGSVGDVPWSLLKRKNENLKVCGGRENALRILEGIDTYRNYRRERDFPALDATTHISAHNKFGTCSIREVYHKIAGYLGEDHPLIGQLYWRDFFTQIGFHFPHVFGREFREKYEGMMWSYDKESFQLWCAGKTGFPIVDAGMRELNATGYMHNRMRMITASFLVKDLHVDWRLGEKYFAQHLVDYDPCVNNGNWQWAASTGCDAQPYFRVFNPWRQQKRFDPECEYIKKWIPELSGFSAKEIHELENKQVKGYPDPVLDHKKESEKAKAAFSAM